MKLQHHLDYFKAQKHPQGENTWENIQLIARAAKEYSASNEDMGRVEAMIGRVSRIHCNAISHLQLKSQSLTVASSPTELPFPDNPSFPC